MVNQGILNSYAISPEYSDTAAEVVGSAKIQLIYREPYIKSATPFLKLLRNEDFYVETISPDPVIIIQVVYKEILKLTEIIEHSYSFFNQEDSTIFYTLGEECYLTLNLML